MAEMLWHTVDVKMAGPAAGETIPIMLTDTGGAFQDRWFYAHEAHEKEMLATALTALSTGAKATVMLHSRDAYSQIQYLYLHKPPT